MAQGFYNAQEASAKLKKTEDELRKLVRDGQLREFRDAKGVMYRSNEVDALAGNSPADSAAGNASQDSVAELTLADSVVAAEPTKPAKTPPPAKPAPKTEDTSVFSLDASMAETDPAKTDVFSLEVGTEDKKSGSGSGSSISLLDDLDNITIPADPMAETVVASPGIELEGGSVAGGSGLLDLARESDDTSLGAELYDESAEGAEAMPAADSGAPAAAAMPRPAMAPSAQMDYYVAPTVVETSDPMAPAFIGMSIIGLIALLIAGMAVTAAVIGSWPGLLSILYSVLWMYALGALVAAGAAWGIGWFLGRQAETRRYAMSRAGTAAQTDDVMP